MQYAVCNTQYARHCTFPYLYPRNCIIISTIFTIVILVTLLSHKNTLTSKVLKGDCGKVLYVDAVRLGRFWWYKSHCTTIIEVNRVPM